MGANSIVVKMNIVSQEHQYVITSTTAVMARTRKTAPSLARSATKSLSQVKREMMRPEKLDADASSVP